MTDETKQLHGHLQDYWEFVLKNSPTFATYIGDHRYDDLLEDLSEAAIARQVDYFKNLLAKLKEINESSLNEEDMINLGLIKTTLSNSIEEYGYRTHYLSLDHLSGMHIGFPQITEFHPFMEKKDFENYVSRLKAFPDQIEQVIGNMKKGMENHITVFNKVMDHVLVQVEAFTGFDTEANPLFIPALKMGDDISESDKDEIGNAVKEAVSSSVAPAYEKLFHFLKNDYMHHCRDKEGVWSLPEGTDMYRFYVRYHTTTDLSPEEIHGTGKSEVKRISEEIRKIIKRMEFDGGIREFAEYVKTKKELYPETGREIVGGYRDILLKMDKKLPQYFGRLPKAEYDIKEIEKYREQAAPAAYYYPPPKDFSRPGYFYINTYKPESRPRSIMEALAYHEAVPGHHLQIAIMQELEDIPDFRRYQGSTAYIEGWALYAEKLAKEMGFYQQDFSEYGRLTNEIWRAARLVVDTGIHYFKWRREEAIQYCRENTGLEEHEIEVEIDRYIAIPGQALAYKTGELKILQLRERADID
jgi:uncharacterized protein (DUF885 family)